MPTPSLRLVLAALTAALLAGANVSAQELRKGRWKSSDKIPEGWIVHRTPKYEVQSQVGLDKAKRLADHLETMQMLYRSMFPPDKQFDQFPVKLFKDRKAFNAYGGPPSAAAYYSKQDKELVCYDTGKWGDDPTPPPKTPTTGPDAPKEELTIEQKIRRLMKKYEMDILGVVAHEAWHQYFHHIVLSFNDFPSWVDEGLGDYFYTARPVRRQGVIVKPALGGINDVRLPTIQHAIKTGKSVGFKTMLRFDQAAYYGDAGVNYAQGWSMCHFLMTHKDRRYREVIKELIKAFKISGNMSKATEVAFKGLDLDQMEKEWKEHVLGLKLNLSPEEEETLRVLQGDDGK